MENQVFDLNGYTRLINASFTPQLRVARLFAKVVYALPQLSSDLLSRSPYLQQLVIDVIQGRRTFREIASASVSGVPRVVTETLFHPQRLLITD